MALPQVDIVRASVGELASKMVPVESEVVAIGAVAGRVLSKDLPADSDSPKLDVSAMDGYAIRLADLPSDSMLVSGVAPAGGAPTELQPGTAIRIFTGAPIPLGADCVVKREDTDELPDRIKFKVDPAKFSLGLNIRRQGENVTAGEKVLGAGALLNSPAMAAVASFGGKQIAVRRRVRVTVLNTGDELADPGEDVRAWQIRDSNGPMLDAWLLTLPWIDRVRRCHVADTFESVRNTLEVALQESDAVILTGGVSMGDTDYVPAVIESMGGHIAFHRLPIRPGRPVLGASFDGKLILGLPGNPVSVAVTSRVIGLPLLKALAGIQPITRELPKVELDRTDARSIELTWYRLVDIDVGGQVQLSESKGSGDLVSLARSSGFVEVAAGQAGKGPWPLYLWS